MDRYPLYGRLFCGCGQRFVPGSSTAPGREYVSLCGCRLWPINAAVIEQRVYAYASSGSSASEFDAAPAVVAAVLSQFGERIEVGGTLDDIRFMRPT
ncbi:hypothetical protein [Dactylosporangium sp. CA-092794]|uniref:hypothetical protein n=1 Tax=Dactylosporangium sp. CA-092794 TaxID=3239929 RepID=UPI003D8DCCF3